MHGYAPSMREIRDSVGAKSTSTVSSDLCALQERGLIKMEKDKPRAISIVKTETEKRPAAGTEDKQHICDLLLPALQATRSLYDLAALDYIADEEVVIATFTSGFTKRINVEADSGIALIKDVLNRTV